MRRSILETYIDVLTVLASEESIKITHLMYKTNMNASLSEKIC